MIRNLSLCVVILLSAISTTLFAQKGGPRSGYNFTTVADLKTTPVKNQQSVGTCWDYAAISFLETELYAKGNPCMTAELFVAKNAYYEKGYVTSNSTGRPISVKADRPMTCWP